MGNKLLAPELEAVSQTSDPFICLFFGSAGQLGGDNANASIVAGCGTGQRDKEKPVVLRRVFVFLHVPSITDSLVGRC